jgi:hypothetical protein
MVRILGEVRDASSRVKTAFVHFFFITVSVPASAPPQIADMHPVPAAVMPGRKTGSWTSPQAKTPGILVRVEFACVFDVAAFIEVDCP